MAGKTPREAVDNFLAPLNRAVACVTRQVLFADGYEPGGGPYTVTFRSGPTVHLGGPYDVGLHLTHNDVVIPSE